MCSWISHIDQISGSLECKRTTMLQFKVFFFLFFHQPCKTQIVGFQKKCKKHINWLTSLFDNIDLDLILVAPEMTAIAAARASSAPLSSIRSWAGSRKCSRVSGKTLSRDLEDKISNAITKTYPDNTQYFFFFSYLNKSCRLTACLTCRILSQDQLDYCCLLFICLSVFFV